MATGPLPDTLAGLGDLYYDLAYFWEEIGDLAQARTYYQQAVDQYRLQPPISAVNARYILRPLASLYTRLGDYQRAEALLLEAHDRCIDEGKKLWAAEILNDLGIVYKDLKRFESARTTYEKGLILADAGSSFKGVLWANLADLYLTQNQAEQALPIARRAVKVYTAHEDPVYLAGTKSILGAIHVALNQPDQAQAHYEAAINLFPDEVSYWRQKAKTHLAIGKLALSQGDTNRAMYAFHAALTVNPAYAGLSLHQLPDSLQAENTLMEALAGKAEAFVGLGELELAATHYEVALASLEQLEQVFQDEASSVQLLSYGYGMYEKALLLAATRTIDPISLMESSKARQLTRSIQQQRSLLRAKLPPPARARLSQFQEEMVAYEKLLSQDLSGAQYSYVFQARNRANEAHQALLDSLQKAHALISPQVTEKERVSLAQVQQWLAPGQALLMYLWGNETLFSLLITADQYQLFHDALPANLSRRVAAFREAIYQRDPTQFTQAHELYQDLFAPVDAHLKEIDRLIIIPDGPLHLLPFEALSRSADPTPEAVAQGFLLHDFAMSRAYSATLLLQASPARHAQALAMSCLALAPHFAGDVQLEAAFSERSCLNPVSNAAEAEAVLAIWGGAQLLNEQGTIANFRRLAPQYPLIHIASHGVMDLAHARLSLLAFYAKDSVLHLQNCSRAAQDATALYVADVYTLQLPGVEMVVLAACETSQGQVYRGEGVESLVRGFTYAGARSVVASLWRINDQSSARMMPVFHQLLKEGLPKDVALQQAKLRMLAEGPRTRNPYLWAGYIPFGDMRPVVGGANIWSWSLGLSGVLLVLLLLVYSWRKRKQAQADS